MYGFDIIYLFSYWWLDLNEVLSLYLLKGKTLLVPPHRKERLVKRLMIILRLLCNRDPPWRACALCLCNEFLTLSLQTHLVLKCQTILCFLVSITSWIVSFMTALFKTSSNPRVIQTFNDRPWRVFYFLLISSLSSPSSVPSWCFFFFPIMSLKWGGL